MVGASNHGLPLRIMLVDDHAVVREGLRALFEASGELVVAEAATIEEAVNEALRVKPQVIVMDVRLGDESGVVATYEIRRLLPGARVIMLTSFPDEEALAAALLAGAAGFVLKDVTGDDIVRSVRAVARGEQAFDPHLLATGALDRLAGSVGPRQNRSDVPADPGRTTVSQDPDAEDTEPENRGG